MVPPLNQHVRRRVRQAWWRMLFHPRSTMDAILDSGKERRWLGIGALMGLAQVANAPMVYPKDAETSGAVFSWIIVVGPVAGWVLLWAGGWVVWKIGRFLFQGSGTIHSVRLALGWGAMPLIWSLALWVPLIATQWGPLFWESLAGFRALFAGLTLWTLVTLSLAVGRAHQISGWRALGSLILSFSVLSLPLSLLLRPGA